MSATDVAVGPSRPVRWRVGVVTIFFAHGIGTGAWAVAIPQVKSLYGLSDGLLSIVLLLMGFGAVAATPIAGLLTPRFGGTARVLRVTVPLYAMLLAAIPLTALVWPTFAAAAIVGFAFGVFNNMMDVPMNAHATVVEKAWGAPIMSSFHGAWSAGGLVGSALGAGLIHVGADVFTQLGGEAALAAALAAPWTYLIGEGDNAATGQSLAWPHGRLVAFGLIAALGMMAEGSVTDWSTIYLKDDLGLTADRASVGFVGFAFTMFVMRVAGDFFVHRLGRRRTIFGGAVVVAFGVALVTFVAAPWSAIFGFWIVGAGVANMVPTIFSASAEAGQTPSLGIAMSSSFGYAGFLVGPPIIGGIAQATSLRAGYLAIFAAMIVVTMLSRAVIEPRDGTSPPH